MGKVFNDIVVTLNKVACVKEWKKRNKYREFIACPLSCKGPVIYRCLLGKHSLMRYGGPLGRFCCIWIEMGGREGKLYQETYCQINWSSVPLLPFLSPISSFFSTSLFSQLACHKFYLSLYMIAACILFQISDGFR